MKHRDMVDYQLPYGWQISFPDEWFHETVIHESGDEENVFFPSDSDLTVRITVLRVTKWGIPVPVRLLEGSVRSTIPKSARRISNGTIDIQGVRSIIFEDSVYENGEQLAEISVYCIAPGILLIGQIFSVDIEKSRMALHYFEFLRKE